MFDIGWSELLVIAVVAVVVVGPRELPGMLRNFGKYAGQMRKMAGDFQRQFNDALKEAELDEVRKSIESVRSLNPVNQLKDSLNPMKEAGESLRKAIEDPGAPKPKDDAAGKTETAGPAAESPKSAEPAKSKQGEAQAAMAEAARTAAARSEAAPKPVEPAPKKKASTTKKPAGAPKKAAAKPKAAKSASADTAGSGSTKSDTAA